MTKTAENLVIVVGHAAFNTQTTPDELPQRPFDVDSDPWVLAPFQKGEPRYYGEHIKRGLEVAGADPASLMIASGGFTRREAVGGRYDWSEAQTYLTAAERTGWFTTNTANMEERETPTGSTLYIPRRVIKTTDGNEQQVASNEYARDSIENLLGDIATFMALHDGKVPDHVTVVGWKFKSKRFDQHAAAIGVPQDRYTYVGVNNPEGEDLDNALRGETQALSQFKDDQLGRNYEGELGNPDYVGSLAQKRDERDPLARGNPHWSMLAAIRAGFKKS